LRHFISSPRGLRTLEEIAVIRVFKPGVIPPQKGFNNKLAATLTSQVVGRYFDLEEIKQAAPNARHPLFNDVPCDYGVRMGNQLERAISRLLIDIHTRRAKITLSRPDDEVPPCIMEIQFLVREGRVITIAYMRSWDLGLGKAYDVHLFQRLGLHVAIGLNMHQGEVIVFAGSAHTYINQP